jgi:hypothetical protein
VRLAILSRCGGQALAEWERVSSRCETSSQLSEAFVGAVTAYFEARPEVGPGDWVLSTPTSRGQPVGTVESEDPQGTPTVAQLMKHIETLQTELETLRKVTRRLRCTAVIFAVNCGGFCASQSSAMFSEAVVQLKEAELDRKVKENEILSLRDSLRKAEERVPMPFPWLCSVPTPSSCLCRNKCCLQSFGRSGAT